MTTRAVGPAKGWDWLMRAVNLGRNNPKAIFGAVAWVALLAVVPSILQLGLQYGLNLGPNAVMSVVGATTLLSLVFYPLLIGGLLRVIDSAENGRPTRASAVFDPFRSGSGAGRLIGFGLLVSAIYLGLFLAVIYLFGQDFMHWYWNLITTAQSNPAAAPQMGELPAGFGKVMGFGTLVALFMGGVYGIGFGQVAIGGRRVFEALSDGMAGTLKNVLPIVVLAVMAFIAYLVLVVAVVLLALLIGVVAMLSKALAVLLAIPLVFAFVLGLYAVLFGVMYYMWRDICGDGAATRALPSDQIQA